MAEFRFKLAVFDVDGTLTKIVSIWEYLHRELEIWETQGKPNLLSFLNGEIDYNEFARLDAEGYRDLPESRINEFVDAIPWRPGVVECFQWIKKQGMQIALISTGLNVLVDRFPLVDYRIANKLQFKNGRCTGKAIVCIPIDGKKSALDRLLTATGIQWMETIVIGDSEGDREIMSNAGLSIAVAPSDSTLLTTADVIIDGTDLMEITGIVERYGNIKDSSS
jgi:phosphoserine phosphatase